RRTSRPPTRCGRSSRRTRCRSALARGDQSLTMSESGIEVSRAGVMLEGMRSWPLVALWVCVAGCHSGPPACTGVCTPPTLTRLDLLAGQPGGAGWVDGAGSAAHFADPWTIVGDHAGHLYVADGLTLRAIDLASATVTTLAGTFALPGASDGVGGAALVYNPSGLVFSGGALYF